MIEQIGCKYVFNICSVIEHTRNEFFDICPRAKMPTDYRPAIGNYFLVEGSPIVINAFCQLFPGVSRHHNDNIKLRLSWFENVLDGIVGRLNKVSSIGFPPNLDDSYLLKIQNFAKKYQLYHNIKPIIKDYNGKTLVDFSKKIEPKYYYQRELSVSSQPNFSFPYRVVKTVDLDGLQQLIRGHAICTPCNPLAKPQATPLEPPARVQQAVPLGKPGAEPRAGMRIDKPEPVAKPETADKPEAKAEAKPEAKPEAKAEAKTEVARTKAFKKPEQLDLNEEISLDEENPARPSIQISNPPTKKVRRVRILKNKYVDLFKAVDKSWHELFFSNNKLLELLRPINDKLVKSINDDKVDVLPHPYDLTYNCFNLCRHDQLKVVILGQDPYFSKKNEAMGLSFSVPEGVTVPPSLRNIFKELADDIDGFKSPKSGDLTKWARQGVLLLNTSLTVIHTKSASHMDLWRPFTNELIRQIAQDSTGLAFILWGNHARAFKSLIPKNRNHLILESAHPSPMSANNGFFGSAHFSQCNKFLAKNGRDEVNWCL